MIYNLNFFTQYGQFYVVDKGTDGETDDLEFWSDAALHERLACENGILGISIENDYCTVMGDLEILNSPPVNEDPNADHIVEASIQIKSGTLEIQDCPLSSVIQTVALENGSYRVRVSSYNLDEAYQGVDDQMPIDKYRIEIWKESFSANKVLKQWISNY